MTRGKTNRPHDGRHKTEDNVRGTNHSSPVHVLLQSLCLVGSCKPHILHQNHYTVPSQISFALTWLAARANRLLYRFRTLFRIQYVIRPWYESCVRLVSSSDFLLARLRAYDACALVIFVLYSESFRRRFVIIRLLSFKIHIRYSYEKNIHFFQLFQSN